MTGWRLVIHWLAVHRLTQLWTADRILRRPRVDLARAIYERDGHGDRLRDLDDEQAETWLQDDPDRPFHAWLLVCPWCVSIWCSILLRIVTRRRLSLTGVLADSTAAVIIHDVIAALSSADK